MQYEYMSIRGRIGDRETIAELNKFAADGWRVNNISHVTLQGAEILLERIIEKEVMVSDNTEAEFHDAMVNIYHIADRHGYRPTYFLNMVRKHGGLEAARRLINSPGLQSGLSRLWKLGLLDQSAEALVLQERWRNLFTEVERRKARERLIAYGYKFD